MVADIGFTVIMSVFVLGVVGFILWAAFLICKRGVELIIYLVRKGNFIVKNGRA